MRTTSRFIVYGNGVNCQYNKKFKLEEIFIFLFSIKKRNKLYLNLISNKLFKKASKIVGQVLEEKKYNLNTSQISKIKYSLINEYFIFSDWVLRRIDEYENEIIKKSFELIFIDWVKRYVEISNKNKFLKKIDTKYSSKKMKEILKDCIFSFITYLLCWYIEKLSSEIGEKEKQDFMYFLSNIDVVFTLNYDNIFLYGDYNLEKEHIHGEYIINKNKDIDSSNCILKDIKNINYQSIIGDRLKNNIDIFILGVNIKGDEKLFSNIFEKVSKEKNNRVFYGYYSEEDKINFLKYIEENQKGENDKEKKGYKKSQIFIFSSEKFWLELKNNQSYEIIEKISTNLEQIKNKQILP